MTMALLTDIFLDYNIDFGTPNYNFFLLTYKILIIFGIFFMKLVSSNIQSRIISNIILYSLNNFQSRNGI